MVYLFILMGIVFRLIPHLPNATPVAAIALLGGTYLNRRDAFIVPIAIMIVSDALLGFHSLVLFTWGAFILTVAIGIRLKEHKDPLNITASAVASSLLFYLITNFGVWAVPGSWYPHTFRGLLDCYVMGLPFLRFTMIGDLIYVAVLFGIFEAVPLSIKMFGSLKRPVRS